jgi:hypothetical protein
VEFEEKLEFAKEAYAAKRKLKREEDEKDFQQNQRHENEAAEAKIISHSVVIGRSGKFDIEDKRNMEVGAVYFHPIKQKDHPYSHPQPEPKW